MIRNLLSLVAGTIAILVGLWSVGAAAGFVYVGFCMVARCGVWR